MSVILRVLMCRKEKKQKLSIQYCVKLLTSTHNPAYKSVFNSKFKKSFDLNTQQHFSVYG